MKGDRAAMRMRDRALARFREDLERLANDAGITHAALARAAGISPGYLADLLKGNAEPSFGTSAKLAIPLGADLSVRLSRTRGR